MLVNCTVLFWAALIPQFEGFVLMINLEFPAHLTFQACLLIGECYFLLHGFHSSKDLFLMINLEFPGSLTFLAMS